jgi:hypothetical protein
MYFWGVAASQSFKIPASHRRRPSLLNTVKRMENRDRLQPLAIV